MTRTLALFGTALLLACPGTDGDADPGPADRDDVPATDAAGEVATPDTGREVDLRPTLDGQWALRQVRGARVDIPGTNKAPRTTTSTFLMNLAQGAEGSIQAAQTACAVKVDTEGSPVQTHIPDALIRNLPVLRPGGTVDGSTPGAIFRLEKVWDVRGAKLADPENDPLPTGADDPTVLDQDEDGYPGVTVKLSGLLSGDVYVAQRIWTVLDGILTGDGALDGRLTWGEEQQVLGANPTRLNIDTKPVPDPDPDRSWFRAVRIPDDWDCETLMQQADALLAR